MREETQLESAGKYLPGDAHKFSQRGHIAQSGQTQYCDGKSRLLIVQ